MNVVLSNYVYYIILALSFCFLWYVERRCVYNEPLQNGTYPIVT